MEGKYIQESTFGFIGQIQKDLGDCYQIFWKKCNHNSRIIQKEGIPIMFFKKEWKFEEISLDDFNSYSRY
jgi:hypothetical protein